MIRPTSISALALAVATVALTACFNPVTEVQCLKDSDCDAGACVNGACTFGTGGGGQTGGGTGAGTMGGGTTGGGTTGGGTTGGGTTGGGVGGGPVGGGPIGGGPVGGGPVGGGGTTCGCKDPTGTCRTGDSPIACGSNGAACQACNVGEQCVSGQCVMAACGPMTCSGCCAMGFCVTPTQQTRFACGSNGSMCSQCGMGQACVNGSCQTPVCDAMTCPTGCCINGSCQAGTSRFACGTGGAMCSRCGMGQQCQNNMCVGGGFMDGGIIVTDGGTPVGIPPGSPCVTNTDCNPPQQAFCIAESVATQPTGYTGGYCTQTCGANQPCPGGSACITEAVFGATQSTCRAACMAPGTQSTCRTGYVCNPSSLSSVPGFCRPKCTNMGALSACPQGQTCNTTTGVCN